MLMRCNTLQQNAAAVPCTLILPTSLILARWSTCSPQLQNWERCAYWLMVSARNVAAAYAIYHLTNGSASSILISLACCYVVGQHYLYWSAAAVIALSSTYLHRW